jgi:CO/xanthine dehydrogenase Mo-binding subunit
MKESIVGRSINRVGGVPRVMGTQVYVADVKLPNMLHTKLVRLDCAHARIRGIDVSEALKVEGVRAVLSADDLPKPVPRFGPASQDRPLLAAETTQFHGEPVAIVAAESEHAAAVGASRVKVDYEELPAICSIAQALDPAAELVQDPSLRADGPFKSTNVLDEWNFGWGDVDGCKADEVIENNYVFPIVTQFAIEPFAFLAEPTMDGITVYSAIQIPYGLQRTIAAVLGLPLARVRIIAPDPGGAFGGKQHPKYEPLLAYLAVKLGRPVRLELTLEESFQEVRRAAAEVRVRTGFQSDGTLVFQDIESNYLIGAYADIAGRVVSKASYVAAGPYRVPNVRILARAVFSHTTPSTAFRGFGAPQENWAVESQLDAIASRLGMDRIAIRLKNFPKKGEVFMPEDPPADGDWAEVLRRAAEAVGWGTPLPKDRGRGIAMGLKAGPTTAASYSIVRLHLDGSATVYSGTSDMGQGARTVFTQIVSEELGIPAEKVLISMGDTVTVPFDLQTSASRSTVVMGNAIINACEEVKRKLKVLAAECYGAAEEEIRISAGVIHLPGEDRSFPELLEDRFGKVKGEVIGVGSTRYEYLKGHPLGGQPAFYEVVAVAAEVEVDRETGETGVHKLVVVGDVGKAINPQAVAMQDEGAAVQALGHSIMEHYVMDPSGRVLNLGALDYRIPTTKDVPGRFTSIHVENADGPGPYGAKGVAEGGTLATAPAIGAAVEEAIGVRIPDLPLTPERIWTALRNKDKEEDRDI